MVMLMMMMMMMMLIMIMMMSGCKCGKMSGLGRTTEDRKANTCVLRS